MLVPIITSTVVVRIRPELTKPLIHSGIRKLVTELSEKTLLSLIAILGRYRPVIPGFQGVDSTRFQRHLWRRWGPQAAVATRCENSEDLHEWEMLGSGENARNSGDWHTGCENESCKTKKNKKKNVEAPLNIYHCIAPMRKIKKKQKQKPSYEQHYAEKGLNIAIKDKR